MQLTVIWLLNVKSGDESKCILVTALKGHVYDKMFLLIYIPEQQHKCVGNDSSFSIVHIGECEQAV